MSTEAKCPFAGGTVKQATASAPTNANWWPNQLKLGILHQHTAESNPMGESFDYAEARGVPSAHQVADGDHEDRGRCDVAKQAAQDARAGGRRAEFVAQHAGRHHPGGEDCEAQSPQRQQDV